MKKWIALALSMAMMLSLAACGGSEESSSEAAPASSSEAASSEAADEGGESEAAPAGEATPVTASGYPDDDITIIVPFDAGGGNDIVARVIAKVAMEGGYFNGQNIIVENQPGGGGAIGQAYVANSAEPDGYTMLAYTASVISNTLLKDVPFTVDDLKVVRCVNSDPAVMIARPDAPFNTIEEMLEYSKTTPLIINDSGFGTSSHIRTLDWTGKVEAQLGEAIQYQSIHSDSGSTQIAELMGGHADVTCLTAGECADAILEGQVKAIGIMTEERFSGLPDVPTFKELGFEGWIDGADRAIAVPADTPDDVTEYLINEFDRLCSSEEFISQMETSNLTPANDPPEKYQEFIDGKVELITSLQDYLLAGADV